MDTKFLQYHGLPSDEFLSKIEEESDFSITPPIDLEKIIDVIGAKLDTSIDMDNISTAGSVSLNNNHARIWINPLENSFEPRKRFTLAHEIAHLLLHISPDIGVKEFIDTNKTLNRKDSYWDSKEYEANNYAARLLMPKSLLKKHGNEIIKTYMKKNEKNGMPTDSFIIRMSDLFKVSEPAMKYRLKNIGAIK